MSKPASRPAHLGKRGRELWAAVANVYELEQHHWTLLRLACEAADRTEEARRVLDTNGLIIRDRFGGLKQHPCVAVERDSRLACARLLREMALDIEAPEARPPRVVPR
jgi:P27 family predicted phage terminase small subunit